MRVLALRVELAEPDSRDIRRAAQEPVGGPVCDDRALEARSSNVLSEGEAGYRRSRPRSGLARRWRAVARSPSWQGLPFASTRRSRARSRPIQRRRTLTVWLASSPRTCRV